MPVLRIAGFMGSIPRLHPRLLGDQYATLARNTRLENGAITPVRVPALAHDFGAATQTMFFHNGAWLGWNALVNVVPGPIASDRLYITGDGAPKMRIGSTTYALALPAPADEPDLTLIGTVDPELAEDVIYAYTWVTSFDEESAPSPLSAPITWSPGNVVRLTGFSAPPASRGVNRIRFYRSQTGATGQTELFYVDEVPLPVTQYDHDQALAPTQDVIPTADFDTPPADMKGIIALPNGIMAAISGKEILFCEPYLPHAWPGKYTLVTDYPGVALAAFGTTLVIATTGLPYIVQGLEPGSMTMERVEQNLPCVAARSMADLGYTAVYASNDGLVTISAQGAGVVTQNLWTRDQWRALNPETIVGGQYGGRYVFSCLPDGAAARVTYIVDLSGEQPFLIDSDTVMDQLYYDIPSSNLYFLAGDEVHEWDPPGGIRATYVWRSKVWHGVSPMTFGAILVEGDTDGGTGLAIRVFADGQQLLTDAALNEIGRIASVYATRWQVEVEGDVTVSAITLGGTPTEIAEAG